MVLVENVWQRDVQLIFWALVWDTFDSNLIKGGGHNINNDISLYS